MWFVFLSNIKDVSICLTRYDTAFIHFTDPVFMGTFPQHFSNNYFCINQNGKNALHISCENGNLEVAETLLSKKAYPDAKTKVNLNKLHLHLITR